MEESANSYPPWMYCDYGTCRCGEIPYSILRCDDNWPGRVSVLDCYCLTYNEEEHTNELGHCLFNCARKDDNTGTTIIDPIHHPLPMNVSKLNDFMCEGFNRKGTLCGKCKDAFYPMAYSYDMKCIKCGNRGLNGLKYILVCLVPLTIFCFIVLLFKISSSLAWVYLILSNHICASNGTSLSPSSQGKTRITTCSKMLIISIWNMES